MRSSQKTNLTLLMREASELFKLAARRAKILTTVAWEEAVIRDFFASKESQLPKPTYAVNRDAIRDAKEGLARLRPRLQGDHPVLRWLDETCRSYDLGLDLLLELETDRFYAISAELYGDGQTRPFDGSVSNVELARGVSSRLSVSSVNDIAESRVKRSAEDFANELTRWISRRKPTIPIKVELTDSVCAKVAAGMSRVRIRRDARFSDLELRSLWNHEVESHCLTAHNGSAQENCDFLVSGGPRTTMTQEGLAVFYEMYGHAMSQRRLISLCDRIEAVHMAREGADFVQVYRWFKDRSENPQEAFYNSQRVFRGARITGGAPFTKDTVYLPGLLGVYNFLRLAVKNQNRLLVETLVCGRISLDDVGTIAWLRTHGILSPPRFVPEWLRNWESLLSFFSFFSFLGTIDMSSVQNYLQKKHSLQEWDFSL